MASVSMYPAERSCISVVSVGRDSVTAHCFQVTRLHTQEENAWLRTHTCRLLRGLTQERNLQNVMTPVIVSIRVPFILIPVMEEKDPIDVTAVARDSVAAQASPFITELTLERNLINVQSVVNALVRVQTFSAIRESTRKRNHTDVKSAARASVGV